MLCSWVLCYSLLPSYTVSSSPRRAVMWEGRVCGLGVGDESGERNMYEVGQYWLIVICFGWGLGIVSGMAVQLSYTVV